MGSVKRIAGGIMIFIGVILLFMAIIFSVVFGFVGNTMEAMQSSTNEEWEEFAEYAVETIGEIVDVDDSTTVAYFVESENAYYETTLSVSNSAFNEGDLVAVYYDEDSPRDCMVPEIYSSTYGTLNTVFSGVGIGVGIVMAVFGLPILIVGIVLIRKKKPAPTY
ncbi:MAG: hypothetical protein E7291_06075 [Lachnospiraceae bacterium]|nr:hypothetical protein [Lachnospiraceae bacterium]